MQINNSLNRASDAILHPSTPEISSAPAEQEPPLMPELDELQCSGDPGAMLAALTMQSARNQEQTARKMRDDATSAQAKADAAAVQDLRDKASLQRVQGIVDGACEIAKGACELGSGLNGIAAEGAKANAASAKEGDQAAHGYETAQAWDKFDASAIAAGRAVVDGALGGAITDKDADQKMHEVSAETFKRMADDAHDDVNDAKQLLNKALDFYKEYVDTKNQTAMAATHRA